MDKKGENFKKQFISSVHFRTICEVLREIYWLSTELDVRKKIKEAIVMAKKMDKMLRKYRSDYDSGMWEKIDDPEAIAKHRSEKHKKEILSDKS